MLKEIVDVVKGIVEVIKRIVDVIKGIVEVMSSNPLFTESDSQRCFLNLYLRNNEKVVVF